MKLQSTIQALRERCPSFKRHIYGICEWANLPAKINPAEQPSAYVFTLSEDADTANVSKNSYHQDIGTTVAIVVAVPSKDVRGQTASDIFEDLKEEIFKAILGWSPNFDKRDGSQLDTYEYSRLSLLSSQYKEVLFYQLEFSCSYTISYKDTRIPSELDEVSAPHEIKQVMGNVDMIGKDNKPDGQIDARFLFSDFYNTKKES